MSLLTASNLPVGPVPVATATFRDSFPKQLIFYEEYSSISWSGRQLWFNGNNEAIEKLTVAGNWSLVPALQSATITATITATMSGPESAVLNFVPASTDIASSTDLLSYSIVGDKDSSSVATVQAKAGSTPAVTSAGPTNTAKTSSNDHGTNTGVSTSSIMTSAGSSPAASSDPAVPTSTPKKDGIKSGAAAGIAVGCFLAGALIAGLVAWFFIKRKSPAGGVRDSEASTIALMHREKGLTAKTVSVSSGSPIALALENGLPQPLEDKAISGEISKISNLIKNHIQSYYHNRAVSPGMIDYDDLQALGEGLPISVGTLSTLLNNNATREIALRFCLAWVVTSRIQLNESSNTTFLPPEVAKCMQSMNHAERGSRVRSLFYTRWRALTSDLLQSTYVHNPFSAGDGRIRNIQAAATLLNSVLRPFADARMDDGARSRNLDEILKRAAQFAFTLFSQPTAWDFDWQNEEGVKSGSLCIFPALVQVADENGEPIHPPRPFSEAVNRRLDE